MPIKKQEVTKITGPKEHAMTFRFSKQAAEQLARLAEYSGKSKTWVIEELLNDEAVRIGKQDSDFSYKQPAPRPTKAKKQK